MARSCRTIYKHLGIFSFFNWASLRLIFSRLVSKIHGSTGVQIRTHFYYVLQGFYFSEIFISTGLILVLYRQALPFKIIVLQFKAASSLMVFIIWPVSALILIKGKLLDPRKVNGSNCLEWNRTSVLIFPLNSLLTVSRRFSFYWSIV